MSINHHITTYHKLGKQISSKEKLIHLSGNSGRIKFNYESSNCLTDIRKKFPHSYPLYLKAALLEYTFYTPTGKNTLLNTSGVKRLHIQLFFSSLYNIFSLMIKVMLVYKTLKAMEISVLNNK